LAKPKNDLPKSRKESILNCLLMGNISFIYTRDGSRTLDERQRKLAQMPEHVGMKTNIMAGCLK